MKGAKRHMKFTLVIFAKKILLMLNGLFWARKFCALGSALKDSVIILQNESAEEARRN